MSQNVTTKNGLVMKEDLCNTLNTHIWNEGSGTHTHTITNSTRDGERRERERETIGLWPVSRAFLLTYY